MEKGFDTRAFFYGMRPDRSGGSRKIISGSGDAYEIGPAYVEPLVAGNGIHTRFCTGASDHPLGGKVAGETGSNGFAGMAEQIRRYIVIFDFISIDIQHLPVLRDQDPGYFKTDGGRLASLFLDCTLWSGSNSFYYRVYSSRT